LTALLRFLTLSIMLSPKDMIKTPAPHRDRLSAFFGAFELSATSACRESEAKAARLIVAATPDGTPDRVILCARGASDSHHQEAILATASVDFGGATNPLMNALPDTFSVCLVDAPDLRAIITVFVQEMLFERCGRQAAIDGLCRVIVLMMLRRAIEIGTTGPDLLAGLSHPLLHRALVAIHDDPSRAWRIEQLAENQRVVAQPLHDAVQKSRGYDAGRLSHGLASGSWPPGISPRCARQERCTPRRIWQRGRLFESLLSRLRRRARIISGPNAARRPTSGRWSFSTGPW
jgi:hypothetical protein